MCEIDHPVFALWIRWGRACFPRPQGSFHRLAAGCTSRDLEPILRPVPGQSPHRVIHGAPENPGDKAVNKVRHSGMPRMALERSHSLGTGVPKAVIPNAFAAIPVTISPARDGGAVSRARRCASGGLLLSRHVPRLDCSGVSGSVGSSLSVTVNMRPAARVLRAAKTEARLDAGRQATRVKCHSPDT